MRSVHEALMAKHGESPFDAAWLERPDLDHRITTMIDVTEFLWARSGALRAHATQVDPNGPFWFGLTDEELADVYPWEEWVLARSLVGPIPEGMVAWLLAGTALVLLTLVIGRRLQR